MIASRFRHPVLSGPELVVAALFGLRADSGLRACGGIPARGRPGDRLGDVGVSMGPGDARRQPEDQRAAGEVREASCRFAPHCLHPCRLDPGQSKHRADLVWARRSRDEGGSVKVQLFARLTKESRTPNPAVPERLDREVRAIADMVYGGPSAVGRKVYMFVPK